ncbi:MAG: aldehyde dehydrogenase family protein [Anaerolineaceae bacterium]|nr:aldehyde dehydrogenase family protein [Anaerolineaceae bacterium]
MVSFTMTINGEPTSAENTFPVINPATGEIFAHAPECSRAQLNAAMEAAQVAFVSWKKDVDARRQVLRDCAQVIRNHSDELADLTTREQGKPYQNALEEIGWMLRNIEDFAGLEIPFDVLQDDEDARIELHRKPYGVVAAIVPWNFPLMFAGWKFGQALLMGNTMVFKPSPYTPLATLRVGELLREVLPPGVINIVSGGNDLGAAMTAHPIPRKVTFTGSVATGRKVAQSAAADLKNVTLELGGNDPAIVLPDVNPQEVAEGLFWGAFMNTGQACIAIKRLYVHEDIYPQIVDAVAAQARKVRMGNGLDPDSQLGPLNNRMQFERVIDLVEDAKRAGARMVTGGQARAGNGYFFEPTIVTEISDGTRLVDEEQFGPALPIIPYRHIEDALERANDTHFGLGGSIWTNDIDQGYELAGQLECGTAWINNHMALSPYLQPLAGAKWSGVGHELGTKGLETYSCLQVIRRGKH